MEIYFFHNCIVSQMFLCYTNRNEEHAPDENESQEEIQRSEMAMERTNTGGKDDGLSIKGHSV